MNFIKHAIKSKTVQLALIQGIAGVLIAVFTEFNMIGYIAVTKSLVDIYIRSITNQPLSAK